jgi:ABC-2 type transport system ATP-binding protein
MLYALETNGLGKRYRHRWALHDCTVQLPTGRIAGLVGLNGAGKTTLMHLATGLITPDAGSLRIYGETPSSNSRSFLAQIGFVPQERALYPDFSVRDMLTLGQKLSVNWDQVRANTLLSHLKISPKQGVRKLSGGQQAQLALIMALSKKPKLLLLDEPLTNVDPLARREYMKILMEMAAEQNVTILISSHIVSDLEPICDYLIMLSSSRVLLAEDTETLLKKHTRLIVPEQYAANLTEQHTVVQRSHTGRQTSLLLRLNTALIADPSWQVIEISLEDVILAYLEQQSAPVNTVTPEKQEVL